MGGGLETCRTKIKSSVVKKALKESTSNFGISRQQHNTQPLGLRWDTQALYTSQIPTWLAAAGGTNTDQLPPVVKVLGQQKPLPKA